ncbi:uroporphyrinogen-III synthase [Spartinivicinus poritis]|uniref:Uroporphyrinogen-III synthase n=1 Tax=Spartinivicinus poritis TaxID=2994640 RepID=A0ABT5U4Z1_9GAMM|nr:uroporphyrinogen-III synthase [Spartinivicinus sp. A2-2]MDE1461425.1 uroporphyrinogen-III synthase [Spartinivicinus sp. A2-2]
MSILITRPEPEASKLVASLQQQGLQAWALPMLERADLPETAEIRQLILNLDLFQQVIVISPYSAKRLGMLMDQYWPQWPIEIQWFAIGSKTAITLAEWDIEASCSAGVDSEALLTIPQLQQVAENKILIVKGKGGRDLLKQVLQQRGAQVTELPLYQRVPAQYNKTDVQHLLASHQTDTIVATSGEIVTRLASLLDQQWRNEIKLIVPSARVADLSAELGFSQVINANGASEEAMIKVLV